MLGGVDAKPRRLVNLQHANIVPRKAGRIVGRWESCEPWIRGMVFRWRKRFAKAVHGTVPSTSGLYSAQYVQYSFTEDFYGSGLHCRGTSGRLWYDCLRMCMDSQKRPPEAFAEGARGSGWWDHPHTRMWEILDKRGAVRAGNSISYQGEECSQWRGSCVPVSQAVLRTYKPTASQIVSKEYEKFGPVRVTAPGFEPAS